MTRTLRALGWTGVFGLWIVSILVFDQLPQRIPTHFGIGGAPDAWAERSAVSWFLLPTITLLLTGMFTVMDGWLARNPARINLPGKKRIAELPERYHGPVREVVHELTALLNVEVVAIMCLVQRATWVGAFGGSTQGLLAAVLGLAFLSSPALLVYLTLRMQRAVDEAWKQARAEGYPRG